MISINSQEIAQFRSQLSNHPMALQALDQIEDCEGDLEDAAIGLAIHVGQMPTTSENWLEGLAKRCRVVICNSQDSEAITQGNIAPLVEDLMGRKVCPEILTVPVAIYVYKFGIEKFCEPLDYKL
ncbi:MAG: hypothetical protein ACFBSC_08715 [Microcoleaceae cyanobacterium]